MYYRPELLDSKIKFENLPINLFYLTHCSGRSQPTKPFSLSFYAADLDFLLQDSAEVTLTFWIYSVLTYILFF